MAKKVVTIEVNNDNIKICEISYTKSKSRVNKSIIIDTPEETVEDGTIKINTNPLNKIAEAIQNAMSVAKIRTKKIIFTISSTRIANREVIIPYIKDKMIMSVIISNLSEYFPVNIEEYKFSYSILEKNTKTQEKNIRLLVFAAPIIMIESYYKLAARLKLDVLDIDYVGNSIFQILKRQNNEGNCLYIHANWSSTLITLMNKHTLLLQRMIPYGIDGLVTTVVDSPAFDSNSKEAVIDLLKTRSIINPHFGQNEPEILNYDDDLMSEVAATSDTLIQSKAQREKKARVEITDSLFYLISNISRVIDYYVSKNPESKIETIYVAGESAEFKGIGELLKNELGIEVKPVKLQNVILKKRVKKTNIHPLEILANVGVAISPIKFVSTDILIKKKSKNELLSAIRILILCIIASAVLVVVPIFYYNQSVLERDSIKRSLSQLEDIDGLINEYNIVEESYKQIQEIYKITNTDNEQFITFVTDLEKILASINSGKIEFLNASLSDGIVTMQGISDSRTSIRSLIIYLKSLNYVENVEVSQITEEVDEENVSTYSFPIICKIVKIEEGGENNEQ